MLSQQELLNKVMNYGKQADRPHLLNPSGDKRVVTGFKELEKGCLLYTKDEAYPIKFCSFTEISVKQTMMFKRFIPDYLRYIKSKNWFGRILTVISLKVNYPLYRDYFHWVLTDTYRDVDRYCDAVRELYRVIPFEKERDMICSILEHDTGYRFPFQDAISNLNKEAYKENPHKEIKRLFDLVISRFSHDDAEKFKNIYKLLSLYLRVNRKFMKVLGKIVEDMDISQISPSVEDTYWMYWSKIYNYFGLPLEERTKRYYEIKNNDQIGDRNPNS